MLTRTVRTARVPQSHADMRAAQRRSEIAVGILYSLVVLASVVLACIPIVNMAGFIVATGSDTLSQDYAAHAPLIVRMLYDHYDWRNYLADTFYVRSHSFAIPFLIRLLIARLTHWNVYTELYIGFAAAVAKLILMYAAFVHRCRSRWRWVLLPLLAALVFSPSQADDFTNTDVSMQFQFGQLGLALGVWGLVRFPGRWPALVLMAAGGIFASLSGATGPPVWPAFLAGMLLLGVRNWKWYVTWGAAALVGCWPYIYFRYIDPLPWTTVTSYVHLPATVISIFSAMFLLIAVGFPFTQYLVDGRALFVGIIALPLVVVTLFFLWRWRKSGIVQQALPGIVIFIYGLCNIWLLMLGRLAIADWYVLSFIPVWFGLIDVIYVFWVRRSESRALRNWVVIFLGVLSLLFASSNLSYADKVWFLTTRAPVDASCLRNYRIAPLYCQRHIFDWGPSPNWFLTYMARPLEAHYLSVFAPHQEWDLQGDFILPTVNLRHIGKSNAFWSDGTRQFPFSDFRHLNLVLRSDNTLYWTIHLPANTTQAVFRSAAAPYGSADRVTGRAYLRTSTGRVSVFSASLTRGAAWRDFSIPLSAYAGETVTLELTSSSISSGWTSYRFPYIDVNVDPNRPAGRLPSGRFVAHPTSRDIVFGFRDSTIWRPYHMQAVPGKSGAAPWWIIGTRRPYLAYTSPLHVCVGDYRYLYFRATYPRGKWPEDLVFFYRYDPASTFHTYTYLPLITDGRSHPYSFDLRLLELPAHTRLAGFRLAFEDRPEERKHIHRIRLQTIHLIPGSDRGTCR